eukprot:jgi/Mesen1/10911/ME000095S10243
MAGVTGVNGEDDDSLGGLWTCIEVAHVVLQNVDAVGTLLVTTRSLLFFPHHHHQQQQQQEGGAAAAPLALGSMAIPVIERVLKLGRLIGQLARGKPEAILSPVTPCWKLETGGTSGSLRSFWRFVFSDGSASGAKGSDGEAEAAALFRARGRLPVFCWQHPETGAVLARSAQPLTGIIDADEKLVAALAGDSGGRRKLCIADARPRKNALANGALGGGCESAAHYRQTEVVYLGIGNIHVVRDSLARLREYLDTHGAACSDGSASLLRSGRGSWAGGSTSSAGAAQSLQDTCWLQHVHALLAGAAFIAARIAVKGTSVLVHCSWQVLVEMHWAAFGHPFADRLAVPGFTPGPSPSGGHVGNHRSDDLASPPSPLGMARQRLHRNRQGASVGGGGGAAGHARRENWTTPSSPPPSSSSPSLGGGGSARSSGVSTSSSLAFMSPIFLQAYLVEVLDGVLSCSYGNFLTNSHRERAAADVTGRCADIWQSLEAQRTLEEAPHLSDGGAHRELHVHFNVLYDAHAHPGPLLPPPAALAPVLLPELFLRWACPLHHHHHHHHRTTQGGGSSPLAAAPLPSFWAQGGQAEGHIRHLSAQVAATEKARAEVEETGRQQRIEMGALAQEVQRLQGACHAASLAAQRAAREADSLRLSLQALGCECRVYPSGSGEGGEANPCSSSGLEEDYFAPRQQRRRRSSPSPLAGGGVGSHSAHSASTSSSGVISRRSGSGREGPEEGGGGGAEQGEGEGKKAGSSGGDEDRLLSVSLAVAEEDEVARAESAVRLRAGGRQRETCGWPKGQCVRGESGVTGVSADFDAIRNMTLMESYFDPPARQPVAPQQQQQQQHRVVVAQRPHAVLSGAS